jgi:acetyl-CoA carboxylase carboxyltransferase component
LWNSTVLEIMPYVENIRPKINLRLASAELAVMGGTQAAKVLAQIEASSKKWRRSRSMKLKRFAKKAERPRLHCCRLHRCD